MSFTPSFFTGAFNPNTTYMITTKTHETSYAETDANVYMDLIGDIGSATNIPLRTNTGERLFRTQSFVARHVKLSK